MSQAESHIETIQVLQERFRATRKKRIHLAEFRSIFYEVKPELLDHPERNKYLRELIDLMVSQGLIVTPKGSGQWDHHSSPRLPLWIQRTDAKIRPPIDPFSIAWVEELAFAPELNNRAQLEAAIMINKFIIANRRSLKRPVPLRERSLEIFGDEKRLDHLVNRDTLFGGRLPISDIGAIFVPLPIAHEKFGTEKPLLIVENHHTYWSMCQWNASTQIYSAIIWGGGNLIVKHAEGIQLLARELRAPLIAFDYFGDIDLRGIQIFVDLVTVLHRHHQVFGGPAVKFYEWLVRNGRRRICKVDRPTEERQLAPCLPMFPIELGEELVSLIMAGQRIPQESLSLTRLQDEFE